MESRFTMSDTTRIEIISFPTPLGDMTAGFTSKGLAILSFCKPENLEIPTFLKSTVEPYTVTEHKIGIELRKQLDAYFEGSLTDFTIPFDLHGTAFQKSVWQELRNIPLVKLGRIKYNQKPWAMLRQYARLLLQTEPTQLRFSFLAIA